MSEQKDILNLQVEASCERKDTTVIVKNTYILPQVSEYGSLFQLVCGAGGTQTDEDLSSTLGDP